MHDRTKTHTPQAVQAITFAMSCVFIVVSMTTTPMDMLVDTHGKSRKDRLMHESVDTAPTLATIKDSIDMGMYRRSLGWV